jgi:hypothetical protein
MVLAIVALGCGLYLQPAGITTGLYLQPAGIATGLYLQPVSIMIHPQLAAPLHFSAEKSAPLQPEGAGSPSSVGVAENSLPPSMPAATPPVMTAVASPAETVEVSSMAELPSAPVPYAAVNSPAPKAFLKPAKPMTVSVAALREEDRRNRRLWIGLGIAAHSAATFDAWSTRHAITTSGAQELNPLLRPFAGNASLYAAIQVAPALLDFAGRKMMYSRYSWMRRAWWVPQSASLVSSVFCGAHNLSVH